jgi:hypothetical protein
MFIPDYRDGQAPAGVWTPAQLVVAPQWASWSDPDFGVGFVVLEPLGGKTIEQVLGANQLGIDPGYQNLVRVTGYPDSADAPVTCSNWTSEQSPSQLRFDCGGSQHHFAGHLRSVPDHVTSSPPGPDRGVGQWR